MAAQIITKEDLDQFGEKLIDEIRTILGQKREEPRKWLKSYQVRNLLRISPGTLQTLRANGTLGFTKVGGILYYKYDDIVKMMEASNKTK